jgi:mono/diheme cytochrome c family protein
MSALKQIALACFVCSPAVLVVAGLAFATGSPGSGQTEMQLAQAETQPAAPAAEPDAAAEEEEATEDEGPAEFTEAFLDDPAHIEAGKAVWETCGGCHGARAYPGKAPKLKPKKYTPEFVFDRVTNGYKKMPAWKDVFTKDERMDVVAWVLSDHFAP